MSTLDPPIASLESDADDLYAPPLTLAQMTWRRFRRHKMALIGAVVIVLLFVYAFGGALIFTEAEANFTDTGLRLTAPARSDAGCFASPAWRRWPTRARHT